MIRGFKKQSMYPRLEKFGCREDDPSELLEKVLLHAEQETERFVAPIRKNISEIATKAKSVDQSFRRNGV